MVKTKIEVITTGMDVDDELTAELESKKKKKPRFVTKHHVRVNKVEK